MQQLSYDKTVEVMIMMMIVIRTMAMKSKWGKEVCSTKLGDRLDAITVIRCDKSSNNL